MIKFTNNGANYALNMDGTVKADGTAFGTWSTDTENNLELAPAAGSTAAKLVQPATWRTENNRLFVKPDDGDEVDLFDEDPQLNLHLTSDKDVNQLVLAAGQGGNGFAYRLHGEWNLADDFKSLVLVLGAGAGKTELQFPGNLRDAESSFRWNFTSGNNTNHEFLFRGLWAIDKLRDEDDQELHARAVFSFTYDTGAGKKNDAFSMPVKVAVADGKNRLAIIYDLEDGKRQIDVEFAGQFKTKNGKIISYAAEYRLPPNSTGNKSAGVFTLSGAIKSGAAGKSNALDFAITIAGKKIDLQLSGSFGNKSGLNFTFSLKHSSLGSVDTKSLEVGLALTRAGTVNGNRLDFKVNVKVGSGTQEITLSLNFQNGKGVGLGFDVKVTNGRIVSGSLLFGLTF